MLLGFRAVEGKRQVATGRQARSTLAVAHARDRGRNTRLFIASLGRMWPNTSLFIASPGEIYEARCDAVGPEGTDLKILLRTFKGSRRSGRTNLKVTPKRE